MLKYDDFNKYMKVYSEYVELSIALHNYHQQFVKNRRFEPGERVREQLRDMSKLCLELKRACLAASKESKINLTLQKQMDKEAALAYKLANPKKTGPKGPWKHKK